MKKLIVMLAVIVMVGAFTANAMADVSLYGSARFRTYFASVDTGVPGVDSDDDLEWRMGLLSRFGANFKSDRTTGKLEIDASLEKLLSLLKISKIFFHPRSGEHFGMSIVEAMSSGLISIVTDEGGQTEFVPTKYQYHKIEQAVDIVNLH